MNYKENCKFLKIKNGNYICSRNKVITFGCDSVCRDFVLREIVDSVVHSPIEVIERAKRDGTEYKHDKNIKNLLGATRFTWFLLTHVIREIEGVSIEEFKENTNSGELLQIKQTEFSSAFTKDSHLDLVIDYASKMIDLRIDEEPQTTQETYSDKDLKSYSVIARAAYYGAVLLATELQPKESYHNLKKVYSVWICYERPVVGIREPILRYNMTPERDYKYNTKDEKGNDSIYTCRHKFDSGDIFSIILISVPDIEAVLEGKHPEVASNYDLDVLKDLYNLLSNNISNDERAKFYMDKNIDIGGESAVTVIDRLSKEIEEKDAEIEERDAEIKERDAEIKERDAEIKERDAEIARLRLALQKQKM